MLVFAALILVALSAVVPLPGTLAAPMFDEDAAIGSQLPQPNLPGETEKIKRVLKLMAKKGDEYMQTYEIRKKQYVVITVLSKNEFDQEDIDLPQNRMKIILNRNMSDDGLPEYYNTDYTEVHGEILALYFDNTIELFLPQLDVQEGLPYVFVYSFYIPCAGLTKIQYSCAEELANTARVNKDKYKMVVGFNLAWKKTDVDLAFSYLKDVGLYALINVTSGVNERVGERMTNLNIYQESMCKCYEEFSNTSSINSACIINSITRNCTEQVQLYGRMTKLGKAVMDDCLNHYTKGMKHTHGYDSEVGHALNFCSARTLFNTSASLVLGKPISNDPPRWDFPPDDVRWADLYVQIEGNDSSPAPGKIDLKSLTRECRNDISLSDKNKTNRNMYHYRKLVRFQSDFKKERTGQSRTRERQFAARN